MKTVLFSAAIFFSANYFSQSGWSLQQCIDYAVKNNISVKQGELNTQVNKNNLQQVQAGTLPSLNGGATHTYNFGQTIDRYTNKFANQEVLSQNFFLSSQVTLWSGLTQYHNIKQSEYNYKSSVETVNQQKNDLSLNVATAFLQVIYNQQLKEVAKNQVQISKLQLERTEKLADAGTLAKSNVYDIKSQLASDQYSLTSAENNYRISLLTLQQLMNLDSVNNFSVQQPDLEISGTSLDSLNVITIYNQALKTQASIRSAEYAWKGAEKGMLAAKGGMSPTLNLSASIGTGFSGLAQRQIGYTSTGLYNVYSTSAGTPVVDPNEIVIPVFQKTPFSTQFSNNVNKSIGFQLNIPLFNGLRVYTNVGNSKLNVYNQKLSYDLAKQQLFKNIAQAHANAIAAFDKYNSAKEAVSAAEISFGFTETKFNAGTVNSFDFSNAKNRLVKSQADLLNAKFDYIFRLKVLDYYQGKPLAF